MTAAVAGDFPAAAAAPAAASAPPERPAYFATGWTGGHNPWLISLVVTMATFMEVLDTSIANVSLPHIAGDLSVSIDESTWVLTSYLVANAIVLPISGWLSSKFGRKRFYMTCVALFTISSLLCGLAPSLPYLILFRILQGVGGGGLGPSEQAILADTFPPAKRGQAFAMYGMAVVLAPAIGPTLGGFITDHYSWRWVFFINVPVGLLSMFLTSRIVTDPPHVKEAMKRAVGATAIAPSFDTVAAESASTARQRASAGRTYERKSSPSTSSIEKNQSSPSEKSSPREMTFGWWTSARARNSRLKRESESAVRLRMVFTATRALRSSSRAS